MNLLRTRDRQMPRPGDPSPCLWWWRISRSHEMDGTVTLSQSRHDLATDSKDSGSAKDGTWVHYFVERSLAFSVGCWNQKANQGSQAVVFANVESPTCCDVSFASGVWVRMVSRIRRPVASSWWIMSLCNNMGHWTWFWCSQGSQTIIAQWCSPLFSSRSKWKASPLVLWDQNWQSWSVQGQRNYCGHDAGPRWWRSSCSGRRLGESRCHAVGHDSRHVCFWSPVRYDFSHFVLFVSLSLGPLCNGKNVTHQPLYRQAVYVCTEYCI